MRLNIPSSRQTLRERCVEDYLKWNNTGRQGVPSPKQLAGMYYVLYRKRYRLYPISPVADDMDSFDAMLAILNEDKTLAPFCIQALFDIKEFNVKASAFSNPNVLDKWSVVERANKLRSSNGPGEQAEFKSDTKEYGVIRA
jgi:hypothetical protein